MPDVFLHVLPLSLPVIYTITPFLLPKTHVATRATAFTPFIALCAHTFLLSTWAKLRIAFDPDSHNTNTTSPHTTKDTVVSKHFNQTIHNLSVLRISVVQFFTENPKNSRKTDFMRKKYELLWINKLHTYTPIGLNIVTHLKSANIPLILKIQQFSISTFKTSEKHFIKRHYIPQQIFHHLLIHQSQEFAKYFSSYKILMLNFYSLYLCLPHCLSLSHCLSVCLSLSLSLSLSIYIYIYIYTCVNQ